MTRVPHRSARPDPPMPMVPPEPSLAELLRWISEMPAIFRAPAAKKRQVSGEVQVDAVVADLHATLCGKPADPAFLARMRRKTQRDKARLAWVLRACWVLWHPALRRPRPEPEALQRFLLQELTELAAVTPAATLDEAQERREELVRRVMRAVGRRLAGETAEQAADAMTQVDSVEQHALLQKAQQREARARRVREALAKKAAEEAAAKVSRE